MQKHITSGPLAPFVDFLWLAEGYAPAHGAERILPTGRMGLVLDVSGAGRSPGVVSGARASSFILDTSKPLSLLGVAFKAGGGYPFVHLPAGELQDLAVPLDTLWGIRAEALRTELLETNSIARRFHILEEFLIRRLALSPPRSPLVQFALREFQDSSGAATVGDVVDRIGISARRFIAEFRHQVGLPPKAFCRIARFRQVIHRVSSATEVDWSDVALSCGYYDQAHFIHEFREFAGVSPSSYLRCRTTSTNHILMR
ncbi:MAG TPA: helix-turn-helix domain-containing protein [Steroidobacteraceae bacterium]|jgi:AraC-like DNA-binding protein|nr:helix-turn-helix domain-containing protein [Steroidobacteraceae bacterium]